MGGLTPGQAEPGLPKGQGLPGHGCCEHVLSWASPSCGCKAWAERGPGACPPRSPTCCPGPQEVHQAPEGGKSPPRLSPSLIGVHAHSSSQDLQGADTRRGPWRWGQVGLVWVSIQQSPALGSQALWTPYRAPRSPTVLTLQLHGPLCLNSSERRDCGPTLQVEKLRLRPLS